MLLTGVVAKVSCWQPMSICLRSMNCEPLISCQIVAGMPLIRHGFPLTLAGLPSDWTATGGVVSHPIMFLSSIYRKSGSFNAGVYLCKECKVREFGGCYSSNTRGSLRI